jgi:hypothetical protein
MSVPIMFNTFKYINRLKAEAVSSIQWVTKQDLQIEIAPLKAEITLLKWMIGLSLALSVGIISMLSKIVLPVH